jgi:hypothetical protein
LPPLRVRFEASQEWSAHSWDYAASPLVRTTCAER